jgi:hypothetical protein
MSVSQWVWIIGGVIAGLIIFSIAYQQIVLINLATIQQKSSEGYSEVKSIIDNLCWDFAGNKREYTLSIDDTVDGIYAASNQYVEYVSEDLLNKKLIKQESTGKFLCIQIKNKRLNCQELQCNATMPFLGSLPEKWSLIALLNKLTGKGLLFVYNLNLERAEDKVKISLK